MGNKYEIERQNKINAEMYYYKSNTSGFPIKDNYHSPFKDYIESRYTELDFIFQEHIINSKRKLDGANALDISKKWRNGL